MKLAIIGLGKMGSALLAGIINSWIYKNNEIIGADIAVTDQDSNNDYLGITTTSDNHKAVRLADIILLAVKPQFINKVLSDIKETTSGKLVISIVAGISIDRLQQGLSTDCRVIRVMPNTPALVGEGISAFSPGSKTTEEDRQSVKTILQSIGKVVEVEENLMDAVTGLSGSGPAYVYMIIDALADGGVLMGLSRKLALKLAAQTVLGSAKMVMETGQHPGELKDAVASPGGTTIRAIEQLENRGVRGVLISAVRAAAERSSELNELS